MREWLQRIWRKYFVEDPATYDARAAQNTSPQRGYEQPGKAKRRKEEEEEGAGARLLGMILNSSSDDTGRSPSNVGAQRKPYDSGAYVVLPEIGEENRNPSGIEQAVSGVESLPSSDSHSPSYGGGGQFGGGGGGADWSDHSSGGDYSSGGDFGGGDSGGGGGD